MMDNTLITRIMGIPESAVSYLKSNYPNQLEYCRSPEGGIMIRGDGSLLSAISIWLESKGYTHNVRRKGSDYYCKQLLLALRQGKFLTDGIYMFS